MLPWVTASQLLTPLIVNKEVNYWPQNDAAQLDSSSFSWLSLWLMNVYKTWKKWWSNHSREQRSHMRDFRVMTHPYSQCRRVASPYFSYSEEVFISWHGVTPQVMHFCCTAGIASGCLMSSSGVLWLLWSVGSNCSYSTMPACDFIWCLFEEFVPLSL